MHLHTDQLELRFGAVTALDRLSLDFPAGTRAVLWGPAGGGKTTLLKCLAGLLRPTAGHVWWDGEDVARLADVARRAAQVRLGLVFQSDALFDSLTVLDNVLLPLLKRKVARDEALDRAHEALRRVGLLDAAGKRPESLSGGMKKRCGVARAIVARPEVLLADDPFAGLDPVTERSIAELLLEVSEGRTLIVALPDPVESMPVSRRLHLRGGRVVDGR
jgi:phospholipid/cholesterol/gamma-HCH transport system ATP-binding protein